MKNLIYILLLYLFALSALPSVRAMKLQFGDNCEKSCNGFEKNNCEKGKFVMNLNFSPLQFVKSLYYTLDFGFYVFKLKEKTSFYKSFIISIYQKSIWNPPKKIL